MTSISTRAASFGGDKRRGNEQCEFHRLLAEPVLAAPGIASEGCGSFVQNSHRGPDGTCLPGGSGFECRKFDGNSAVLCPQETGPPQRRGCRRVGDDGCRPPPWPAAHGLGEVAKDPAGVAADAHTVRRVA